MPNTIVAIIIIIFAVLPGIPAYKIYKTMNGFDWRVPDWEKIVNVIGFSLFGILLYVVVTSFTKLPKPIYLIPQTFSSENFGINSFLPISISLLGHCIGAILGSFFLVCIVRLLSKFTRESGFSCAWDHFNAFYVPKHWVIVSLTNGESYAGIIAFFDKSVCREDRDIVLSEPAKYIKEDNNYKILSYQQLFLPSNLISSIGVISNFGKDKRLTTIDSWLFKKEEKNE